MQQPVPSRYVLVPDALIAGLAHDPLAIGVYVAIARLALVAKGAVPLAARDLAAWMGSDRDADRAAIMRRIIKLAEEGWVEIERSAAAKHRLLPTWGRDRSGAVRAWCFATADCGRPGHLRGRRLPLTLLDDYLGRLDPQPGHRHALISRYFTRPLLDLADIGVYAIGLRAEVTPTPRLRHLGLHSAAGMLPPRPARSLLAQAVAGTLTTLVGDTLVPVPPSIQGYARLGSPLMYTTPDDSSLSEQLCGSLPGSTAGSAPGSRDPACEHAPATEQDGQDGPIAAPTPPITWDVGMVHESINSDSTPNHALAAGDAMPHMDLAAAARDLSGHLSATPTPERACPEGDAPMQYAPALASAIITGHCNLNPQRQILPGEWCELLALETAHGPEQLLIWQARATRAAVNRPHGITPAYYRACAEHATQAAAQSSAPRPASAPPHLGEPPDPLPALDPACDAMLRAMGVRVRHTLAAMPAALIAAWQQAVAHPGLAAQCTSPIGFAVAQMQRGNAPPSPAELDRWADQACRAADRYESWRFVDAPAVAESAHTHEQLLEARVRALAPADADLAVLCSLAQWLEAGASDAEAMAYLAATHTGGRV